MNRDKFDKAQELNTHIAFIESNIESLKTMKSWNIDICMRGFPKLKMEDTIVAVSDEMKEPIINMLMQNYSEELAKLEKEFEEL